MDPSCTTSKGHLLLDLYPDHAALLDAHGLSAAEERPLAHTGFSGAALSTLTRDDGARFVVKRISIERDWIMRATNDLGSREVAFALAAPELGRGIATPTIGVARDGGDHALLMSDIGDDLLRQGSSSEARLDAVIVAMATLHRAAPPVGVPWCGLERRLSLLTPETSKIAAAYGAPVAGDITRGWEIFGRLAPATVVTMIRSLFVEVSPLIAALGRLPSALLHGDLKFDNIGVAADGGVWLIDWAMPLVAPAAVELGWFLAINERRMPATHDGVMLDVMRDYALAAEMPEQLRERHDAMTVLCGLLLRGWRKALDAEAGEPEELRWWCERAEAATGFL